MVWHCATQDVCTVASSLVLVAVLGFHIMVYVSRPGVGNVGTLCTIGVVSQLLLMMMWFVSCLSVGCQTYHITASYALASAASQALLAQAVGAMVGSPRVPSPKIPASWKGGRPTTPDKKAKEGQVDVWYACFVCVLFLFICWFDLV